MVRKVAVLRATSWVRVTPTVLHTSEVMSWRLRSDIHNGGLGERSKWMTRGSLEKSGKNAQKERPVVREELERCVEVRASVNRQLAKHRTSLSIKIPARSLHDPRIGMHCLVPAVFNYLIDSHTGDTHTHTHTHTHARARAHTHTPAKKIHTLPYGQFVSTYHRQRRARWRLLVHHRPAGLPPSGPSTGPSRA